MALSFTEILKVIFLGIVEGVTEWLPISSTGHMLLVDEFLTLNMSDAFKDMFFVVIQLGAILAVVILFWQKMFPFQFKDKTKPAVKMDTLSIWLKVVVACIPGAVVTLLFDDYIEAHLHTPLVIALMLILYGIAFILIEKWNRNRQPKVARLEDMTYRTALMVGLFQVLSIIPGTSRSGSTILGAIILGVGRAAGAEFSFFLAIPTMLGASVLKLVKFLLSGVSATGAEWAILAVGCVVSFVVSLLVIKGLMEYVRKHSFAVFGVYRIILGVLVLGYFAFQTLHA